MIMLFERNRVCTVLLVVSYFLLFSGCVLDKMCKPDDECLRSRIDQFYSYLTAGSFDKSWMLLSPETRGNKEEYVDTAKRFRMKISNYRIDTISRNNLKAKVKIIITGIENGKEYINESVDCWAFNNGNWYLKTAGRIAEWECNE
jgi:hypothetical protein